MTIKLYKADGSPPVRSVLMLAQILDLKYEPVDVNVMAGELMKPEYMEKNPNHSIPTLDDDGFIVADSHAILTYLVDKYGEKQAQLYPKDIKSRTTVNQLLYLEATSVFAVVKSILGGIIRRNEAGPSEDDIKTANDAYNVLEKYLSKTKFVAADHLTVADISCLSTISTLDVVVPIDAKYAKLTAWFNALKNEEWYKKGNQPGLTMLAQFIKGAMEKNSGKA